MKSFILDVAGLAAILTPCLLVYLM